jgi:transposase InsO family protein
VADDQIGFGPGRHGRQTFQELQRLEDQLSRAVVPRRLDLQRDTAVVPEPQASLREGRAEHLPAQALQPRPIVGRHPLECELLDRQRFATQAAARLAVFDFIEGWYNPRRRHSALDYLSPIAYEKRELSEV